jgi:hypothetical protein
VQHCHHQSLCLQQCQMQRLVLVIQTGHLSLLALLSRCQTVKKKQRWPAVSCL